MLNLVSVFEHSAKEFPGKKAIIFGDKSFTFAQVTAMVNKIANALKQKGIQKGDKVALSCLNLPYFPMVYYAILKTGAVVVPLNVLLKGREIAYHLKDSEAKAYFCFQGTPELPMAEEGFNGFNQVDACELFCVITADLTAPSPIEGTMTMGQLIAEASVLCDTQLTSPEDTAVILYTSGTTGFPKGAELSHSNMTMNALGSRHLLQLNQDDIHVIVLPLFHSFGQTCQMNAGFSVGNTLVLIPKFTPQAVLSAIENDGGTVFAGVPTMYWALLNHEDKEGMFDIEKIAKTLRIGISGASSLPLEIIKGIEKKYKIPILEGYGLSETCPVATFSHLTKERKPGSIGTPIWGVEVDIFDRENNPVAPGEVGEVVIRGHNVMKGYYNKKDATADAFAGTTWFHTGDLGKKDEDGYFYIVDRVKDMIIRGGYNVYPREIEEVLLTHPDISLAAVLGVPHDRHGEEVAAYVVLKPGADITEGAIIEWGKQQMAAYKYPRVVHIRQALPMTATGKILKKDLRAEG
ncbi:MAG: long-chain fatty acid--CoA ligase [Proteobacteria bacterium]|nr:long-chain fatty acid--CoA ligase [Pseudomonadota bacterium]MBU1584253.1 long-chain fatty acid--CoA ligase [Pseudomonadota bacterium]MBU2455507.1 long-chain fatty acid--CoA ligase [Pseudomonadota bacterium]MBU2629393.1 long-chain fatty acid--CoA ligase [Pseudomonadota bacterium]